MSSIDPRKKQPASYREPVLEKLVLNDLIHLSNDSRYDKNVLLWMQDRYVNQAITENMGILIDLVRKGKQEGASPEEMQRERIETLVRLTRETYSSEKSLGRGADLKTYLDAATTFFEAEAVRYAGHTSRMCPSKSLRPLQTAKARTLTGLRAPCTGRLSKCPGPSTRWSASTKRLPMRLPK